MLWTLVGVHANQLQLRAPPLPAAALLPRDGADPLLLGAHPRVHEGLHRHAQAQQLPVSAHHGAGLLLGSVSVMRVQVWGPWVGWGLV